MLGATAQEVPDFAREGVAYPTNPATALPPEQPHELLDRQPSVGDDPAERAGPDLLVVGNDDSGVRRVAPENHMTTRLSAEHEARTFQGGSYLPTGEVGRKLCHEPRARLGGFDLDEFPPRLERNWISGVATVVQVQCDGFPYIGEGRFAVVALADAPRKRGHARHAAAVLLLFQNNGVPHLRPPWG